MKSALKGSGSGTATKRDGSSTRRVTLASPSSSTSAALNSSSLNDSRIIDGAKSYSIKFEQKVKGGAITDIENDKLVKKLMDKISHQVICIFYSLLYIP